MAAQKRPASATASCLILPLLASFTLELVANVNGASLDILPSGDTQSKPVGSSHLLTCKPIVENTNLMTEMQWLDPQNRVIDSMMDMNTLGGYYSKPPMYTELHQDNSLSLFFNSLQEEQAGRYTCKGIYANSIALNKSVTIETIVAITWVNAPPNQYSILGEDFSIVCQVRARPSPSVDWLFNGELIKTNDHFIIDKYSLKIQNVQEADEGIYTCRASVLTTGELQERAIRVEVQVRPQIEDLVSPIEIIEGENANIACKASGKPPPKYSWVKTLTQQNLSSTDRFGVDADTGILTITNVKREDSGEYQCAATNAAGSVNTNVLINVIVKPKIMEFGNETIDVGNNTQLTCKAFGRPPPHVTFRKHTSDKPYVQGGQQSDDRIVLRNKADEVNGETVATLTINNVLRSDDGLYECIAKNPGGEAYKNGHLIVEFPPSFASMSNVTVWSWEQKPVNLSCVAESIPNATIRWTMHDQPVDNFPTVKQIGNGPISILMIAPIDKRFYTNYKCIAANRHGTREHVIQLMEATKPGEILQSKMVDITATTIRFDLVPPPTHPDLPVRTITVQYRESKQQWINSKNKTWSIDSMYVVEGLKPQTLYEFRFAARNEVGLGNWGAFFSETTPGRTFPNEPKIITEPAVEYDLSRSNDQHELKWVTPADNGEPIDLYQISYCQIKRVAGEWETEEGSCQTVEIKSQGRTRYWIKNLKADTFYRVELRAHNAMGYSKPGIAKFKTARGLDTTVVHHQGPLISSAAIIGIVIAVLFIIIIVIDVICCCAHKTGIIYYVCERSRRKPVDEEDAKLGRDEKEPLKEEKKITPIIDTGLRRETSITFDGKRSVSKTGFVGKDSAV